MRPPAGPEAVLDPGRARALLRAAFPSVAADDVRLVGVGWDNTNFRVDGGLLARFPRRALAVPLLRREVRVLPFLAPHLPLAVPAPLHVAPEGAGDFPWPFCAFAWLPGRDAVAAGLAPAARSAWATPLARFLRALHGLDDGRRAELRACGAGADPFARLDFAARGPVLLERLAAVRRVGLAPGLRAEDVRSLLEEVRATFRARTDVPVHGDLHAAQLLVAEDGAPAGVLDWGDFHLGDPACDLAVAHAFLPPDARAAFRAAYGPLPEATWRAARLSAVGHTLAVAEACLGDEDAALRADVELRLAFLAGD